jgi:peptide/nickel transport system substrate-binding protein
MQRPTGNHDGDAVQSNAPEAGLNREQFLRRAAGGAVSMSALVLTACGSSGSGASSSRSSAEAISGKPKRGGTLRIGVTTSGPSYPALDANTIFGWSNDARIRNVYDKFVEFDRDAQTIVYSLAEEFTPEKADTWVIRLRKGVTFHDGKELTADDAIYTLQRWANPKLSTIPGSALTSLNPNHSGYSKLDKYTVRVHLLRGDMAFRDVATSWASGVVPVGYDPKRAIGTGPFMLKSLTANRQSVMTRNPHYWQSGLPYVDELIITDFADATSRTNALISGQVHAADFIPFGQVGTVSGNSGLRILESHPAQWTPFTMRVDVAPFSDVRVRQAMRLIVDRPQMIATALAGHGQIGNDVSARLDPAYDTSLPQRKQDVEQAKSLLKQAGQTNLNVNLYASEASAGMVEAAQVLAQQATAAGVKINVHNVDSSILFGPNYTKWPFAMDFWGTHKYLYQVGLNALPKAVENETHWPDAADMARYLSLYKQAENTVDDTARTKVIHEMMAIDYERGGNIIPYFSNFVDAYSTKIAGLKPNDGELPLDYYTFKNVYFV